MENEGSYRRECVIALWIHEKRKNSEEKGRGSERMKKIETDRRKRVSKRGENGEERHIGHMEHRDAKRKEAERLGRFILDQLHFQPSSEYKRQFNYRGIFKGESHLLSRLSLSFFTICTSVPSSLSFVPLSVDGISLKSMTTRELDIGTRAHAVSADTHRTMCTSLDDMT